MIRIICKLILKNYLSVAAFPLQLVSKKPNIFDMQVFQFRDVKHRSRNSRKFEFILLFCGYTCLLARRVIFSSLMTRSK